MKTSLDIETSLVEARQLLNNALQGILEAKETGEILDFETLHLETRILSDLLENLYNNTKPPIIGMTMKEAFKVVEKFNKGLVYVAYMVRVDKQVKKFPDPDALYHVIVQQEFSSGRLTIKTVDDANSVIRRFIEIKRVFVEN